MFIGHYGVSYAVKSLNRSIPLWLLFVAVQLVDVLWALFVMTGIEKVRIVPGITATNPLDLYYMPYTHSLVAALFWSALGFAAYKIVRGGTSSAALLLGAAVFSHWILDLIVHRPDLPLYDDTMKMGLGLWNYPLTAFALETVLLFGGMAMYMRSTAGRSPIGKYGMPVLGLIMIGLQSIVFFGAPPPSATAAAFTALFAYIVLASLTAWLERKREPTGSASPA